jgi:hypothetical protein
MWYLTLKFNLKSLFIVLVSNVRNYFFNLQLLTMLML